jgi:hypothetical protein
VAVAPSNSSNETKNGVSPSEPATRNASNPG